MEEGTFLCGRPFSVLRGDFLDHDPPKSRIPPSANQAKYCLKKRKQSAIMIYGLFYLF